MFSEIKVEEITNKFGNCIRISNGTLEMVAIVSRGPRIISFGFAGKENEFCDYDKFTLDVDGELWEIVGGHRLWHSPEVFPRTYYPDNQQVNWSISENEITLSDNLQPWVQIKKDISISFMEEKNAVRITHKLTNKNAWEVELAAWALSEMEQGGVGLVPLTQYEPDPMCGSKDLTTVTLWPYASFTDQRVSFGKRFITLTQEPGSDKEFKIGTNNEEGWIAYFNRGNLFVKRFSYFSDEKYPDGGVCSEMYINGDMLEMETLSPLVKIRPGASITHVEEWQLISGVGELPKDEEKITEIVNKYIRKGV